MERAVRVLHVDGDGESRDRLERALREADDRFETAGASTIADATERFEGDDIDCVVSEFELPDGDGLELLDRVRERNDVPFVLFTGGGSEAVAGDAFDAGVTDYLPKADGAYTALARRLGGHVLHSEKDSGGRASERGREAELAREREEELVGGHEAELARERERFSELFENFPEPTIAYGFDDDGQTRFRAVNDAFEGTFEFDEDEILGARVNELIVPEEQRDESRDIDEKVEEGELIDREVRRLTATGSRIFNLRNIPVTTSGEIDGFAVYADITERKLRERELQRYETIVETIPMGILVADEDGRIVNANRPAAEMVGLAPEEVIGRSFELFVEEGIISASTAEEHQQVVRELLSSSTDREKDVIETGITRPDGETRYVEVHTALLPYEERFQGSVHVYHDVTDRTERERELRQQNERLEEFASILSHDLRNPLNVAKGHLSLATREYDGEHLDTVAGALDRMEALIEETLELARQGEMVTETEPLSLAALVDGCWEMVATGDATIDRPDDATLHGDPERVKQLLENLFRNSIQHGGEDVTIAVGVLDDGFYVEDDGPGIPEEERDAIFDPGHTGSDEGTGLGLTIVNRIVGAHGWTIRATESDDGGARFEITGVDVAT